jgi:DNA-binding transcriptional LysR family regulator
LRVTTSAAFGRKVVGPMLAGFMRDNPDLRVDVLMTDDQVDIVGQGIDLAIRIAKLRDNHLVARRLADGSRRLCVSPSYVAAHGMPRVLADLGEHICLLTTGTTHWSFSRSGKTIRHKVSGRLTASSVEALHQACLDGGGIAHLSAWNIEGSARGTAAGGDAGGCRARASGDLGGLSHGAHGSGQGARLCRGSGKPVDARPAGLTRHG